MKNIFLNSLSKMMNAYLSFDPESKHRLKKLAGKIITLELLPWHFTFQCEFQDDKIILHHDELLSAETKISGTPLQMMGVACDKNNRQRFFKEDVIITGDAEVGQQVIALFDQLEIDWQEPLAKIIGDVPAHEIENVIKTVSRFLSRTQETVAQNINEYLHEEKQWFPTRESLTDFFNDIDTLRMDVDRIEIKIKHIEKLITDEDAK